MAKYALYIDDSGTKEYATPPRTYTTNGRGVSRYFVFGGALMTEQAAADLIAELRRHKTTLFGTHSVEIKSSWLRNPKKREKKYLNPFGLTEPQVHDFVDRYYDLVCGAPVVFIAAVIDKPAMEKQYPKSPWYAPAAAYELLMQRLQSHLTALDKVRVFIDNMTGSTPKNRQYSVNLDRQHEKIKSHGLQLRPQCAMDILDGRLKFLDSADHELIQLADLVAYNVYRQFNNYGENWEDPRASLPLYSYLARIAPKFRTSETGRIQGYGIVKLPLGQRVRWTLPRKKSKETEP